MAHLTSEFRFEKYKTAEAAEKALLELHPVGSNIDGLILILKKAGVTVYRDHYFQYKDGVRQRVEDKDKIFANYNYREINKLLVIVININVSYKNNRITKLSLTKYHD